MICDAPNGHACDGDVRAVRTGVGEVPMCANARLAWKNRTWPFTGWETEQRKRWAERRALAIKERAA